MPDKCSEEGGGGGWALIKLTDVLFITYQAEEFLYPWQI